MRIETFLLFRKMLEGLESACTDVEAFHHQCKLFSLQMKLRLSTAYRTYRNHNLRVAEPRDGTDRVRGAGVWKCLTTVKTSWQEKGCELAP